jgi:hypothetical protein
MTDSDLLADLLPVDRPAAFDRLGGAERRWRSRLFLAAWAMGCPESLSWAMALSDSPAHIAESQAILANISDDAIRTAVLNRTTSSYRPNVDSTLDRAAPARSLAHVSTASVGLQGVAGEPDARSQSSAPEETAEGHLDRLLRESRAGDQQPSRITLLVPPRRSEESP